MNTKVLSFRSCTEAAASLRVESSQPIKVSTLFLAVNPRDYHLNTTQRGCFDFRSSCLNLINFSPSCSLQYFFWIFTGGLSSGFFFHSQIFCSETSLALHIFVALSHLGPVKHSIQSRADNVFSNRCICSNLLPVFLCSNHTLVLGTS